MVPLQMNTRLIADLPVSVRRDAGGGAASRTVCLSYSRQI